MWPRATGSLGFRSAGRTAFVSRQAPRPLLTLLAAAGALAATPALAAAAASPWSLPVAFSSPGRVLPSDPAVAVAPEGRAVVAWWRRDTSLAPRPDVVQI